MLAGAEQKILQKRLATVKYWRADRLLFQEKKKCKFILVAAPNIIIISGCGPGLLLPFFLGNKEKTQT